MQMPHIDNGEAQASNTTAELRGRLRNASLIDTAELARLLRATGHASGHAASRDIAPYELLSSGHLLVLDLGGRLAAAVHVRVAHDHATISTLLVDPALHGRQLEDRMISVAHAFCEAYGYELPARHDARVAARARGRR